MTTSMLSRLVTGLSLALLCSPLPALAEFAPNFLPTLGVERATGPVKIDGSLDEAAWASAARATNFAEVSPGDQIEPSVSSEAWVMFDDQNLYVALIAQDDPEEVRASICDRDAIFQDDYFGIMIDPYGDQSSGYELFVNPLGIQGDLRMRSDGNEDGSFDMIWLSEGKVTESGYQVEIAIPFSSLRIPDQEQQTWRVNFWRDHQRDVRRRYAWAAQDRDNPCFMCQWGSLTGLEAASGRRPVELIVSTIGTQASEGDPDTAFENHSPDAHASAHVKYAVSSSSTAEIAVNPDFSQVESDAGRIDVNQTFALFFPERRPFFQEGSDLLDTWVSAIYTRSINDPNVAAKFTGQYSKTSVVYTFAQDENSPIIVPFEERSEFEMGGESISNILRVRRSLHEESFIGALATDRRLDGDGSGSTMGMDGLYRLGNYRLEVQGLASRTEEATIENEDLTGTFGDGHTEALDGETYWGHGIYASLERSARTYSADFDYWDYSPEFRTDNGFTTRNDFRQASFWNGVDFSPNTEWVSEWGTNASIGRVWSSAGTFKDEWVRPEIWLNTKGQTNVGTQYLFSRERFGPEVFPGIRVWSFWFNSRFSEVFSFGFSGNVGQGIYRDLEEPELGDQKNWSAEVRIKPSQRVELNVSLDRNRMDSRERDENLFSGYILRTRTDVNFTRQLFLRLVVQHNNFGNRVDIEPLLTYRVNPFTMFFLGATSRQQRFLAEDYDAIQQNDWQTSDRQLFAKLQYQFHL
ncbi:MAG: hypothetical protein DHS20C21_12730 [Gemmatimonadota bacterium]|nr:MAG: hypothetical protein DHS20C21_12730 [Gemmatimonadota bacterium]